MDSKKLIELLLELGHKALVEQLRELEPTDPVSMLLIVTLRQAVQQNGHAGAKLLAAQITDLLDGKRRDIDFEGMSSRAGFSLVNVLQQLEDDKRSAAKALITKVVAVFEPLGAAVFAVISQRLG